MAIGKFEFRQMLTAERKLCGHDCTGPSDVDDQSYERISSPIVPPFDKNSGLDDFDLSGFTSCMAINKNKETSPFSTDYG